MTERAGSPCSSALLLKEDDRGLTIYYLTRVFSQNPNLLFDKATAISLGKRLFLAGFEGLSNPSVLSGKVFAIPLTIIYQGVLLRKRRKRNFCQASGTRPFP